jgi:hypothetical protein
MDRMRRRDARGNEFDDLFGEGVDRRLIAISFSEGLEMGTSSNYPERDVVNSSCIFQQRFCETELFECLDGFGLHSISLACRCFVVAIIEDNHCDSKADEIATIMLLVH